METIEPACKAGTGLADWTWITYRHGDTIKALL